MRKGWFSYVALPVELRPWLCLGLIAGFLGGCTEHQRQLSHETDAIAELRSLEAIAARRPSYGEYEIGLQNVEPRLKIHFTRIEPLLRLEFERALAWYKLADFLWENQQVANGRSVPECLAEAKRQTDWLQRYVASDEPTQRRLMAQKETERVAETNAARGTRGNLRPTVFSSPLNPCGSEDFFSRPIRSTPSPRGVAPAPPIAVPVKKAPAGAVILTAQLEAKLPFGKVKLQPGTRLEVLDNDGTTITAKYGADKIAIPAAMTKPAP